MKIIIGFFIFCLVLFIYLHIQFHLKKSEDLEMYEIDDPSKDKLEEICDIRQPVLFDFDNEKIMETSNKNYIAHHYHAFEIKIRNVNDNDNNSEIYIPLPLHASVKLFNEDHKSSYFSENNTEFYVHIWYQIVTMILLWVVKIHALRLDMKLIIAIIFY